MKDLLENILPSPIHEKWTQYLQQRNSGLKNESKKSLTSIILNLESLNNEMLNQFVFYLTDLQRTDDEKIDYSLFEKIIMPCLIDGMMKNLPTYNRRLAQFDQMLLPTNPLFSLFKTKTGYGNDFFEKADFYKRELEINPDDKVALDGLLHRMARRLNYAIHELPMHGLLWEINFFDSEILEFKRYLSTSDNAAEWQTVLTSWDFVASTWKDYEVNQGKYQGYADYLKANELRLE